MAKRVSADKSEHEHEHEQSRAPLPIPPEDHQAKPNGSELPSAEPGAITDLSQFVDDDSDPVSSNLRRVRCTIGRPNNFTRFRTWPDRGWWRIYHFLIRERAGQNSTHFLVHKSLLSLDELEGRTKRKRLVPYVTHSGGLGMWPMGLDEDNPYVSSALTICDMARTGWACAVTQGREDGEYHYKAPNPNKDYGEPKWPEDLTLAELVNLAFPRDRQILTRDHPELVRLRDED